MLLGGNFSSQLSKAFVNSSKSPLTAEYRGGFAEAVTLFEFYSRVRIRIEGTSRPPSSLMLFVSSLELLAQPNGFSHLTERKSAENRGLTLAVFYHQPQSDFSKLYRALALGVGNITMIVTFSAKFCCRLPNHSLLRCVVTIVSVSSPSAVAQ